MLTTWRSEVRQAVRALARRPVVTLAVVLSVTLGIGVNTAIFTVIDAIFLRPVPAIDDPDRIVYLYGTSQTEPDIKNPRRFSNATYRDFRERMTTVSALAAGQRIPIYVTTSSETRPAVAYAVTPNYFEVLGLEPSLGRFFASDEDRAPGAHPVVFLSHGFWQRELGGASDILDQDILLNNSPYTVIGVGPPGFQGTEVQAAVDMWVPFMMWPALSPYGEFFDIPDAAIFDLYGRIAPDSSLEAVDQEAQQVAAAMDQERGWEYLELTVRAESLHGVTILPREREDYVRYAQALAWGVFLVLLLCCINVACLLMVQGRDRAREIATRQALGARRGNLFRQLLTENLLLFLAGGVLAVAAAYGFAQLLWQFRPPRFVDHAVELDLDLQVLAYLFLLTLVAGLLTGLFPAWRAARKKDLTRELHSTPETPRSGRRLLPWGTLLVIPQAALALIALVAGSLYYQGLEMRRHSDLGFEPERLAVLTVSPGAVGYSEDETRRFYDQLISEVEDLPGVSRAGLSTFRLLRGAPVLHQVYLPGEDVPPDGDDRTSWRTVAASPAFFETVGIDLLDGRTFTTADGPDSPPVLILNQYLDETLWPDRSAAGEQVHLDYPGDPPMRVVGVAENAKYRYMDEEPMGFLYRPIHQAPPDSMVLHARVEGDPAAYVQSLRNAVRSLDADVPVSEAGTMTGFLDEALWKERSTTHLLNGFGILCLLLAALGIYGVTRYSVRRRQREIGIRIALGAPRRGVLWQVMRGTGLILVTGVVLGLILAFLLVQPMVSREIPEIGWGAPWAYLLPALLLVAGGLLGAWMPARKASRFDPMQVLGTE